MKTVLNLVLAACVICLVYICYGSIMGPINFDNAKKTREKAIIARLIDIRKALMRCWRGTGPWAAYALKTRIWAFTSLRTRTATGSSSSRSGGKG